MSAKYSPVFRMSLDPADPSVTALPQLQLNSAALSMSNEETTEPVAREQEDKRAAVRIRGISVEATAAFRMEKARAASETREGSAPSSNSPPTIGPSDASRDDPSSSNGFEFQVRRLSHSPFAPMNPKSMKIFNPDSASLHLPASQLRQCAPLQAGALLRRQTRGAAILLYVLLCTSL
jgi:hypothetical protein